MSQAAKVIGVAGAGTMGAGIAQLAALSGARTLVHDPSAQALERGLSQIRRHLERGAARGRWTEQDAQAAGDRLEPVDGLHAFADCDLVIEAAPERLDLKRDLFNTVAEVV